MAERRRPISRRSARPQRPVRLRRFDGAPPNTGVRHDSRRSPNGRRSHPIAAGRPNRSPRNSASCPRSPSTRRMCCSERCRRSSTRSANTRSGSASNAGRCSPGIPGGSRRACKRSHRWRRRSRQADHAKARPARSKISGTLSSHATAMTWQPATPSVSRRRWMTSTQIFLPSSPSSDACSIR